MGVKSTVDLTRDEAERRYIEAMGRRIARIHAITDRELADTLMMINDEDHGGEGFENYRIRWTAGTPEDRDD